MNTIQTLTRVRGLRAIVAALGVAAALATLAPADASAQRTRRSAAAQDDSTRGVVNIQTASVEQLQLLPGVGPSKAQAIVDHRERRAFRRIEDILRVRGIGRATFRHLRPMITVDGPTTMREQARTTRSADDGEEADPAQE